MKAVIWGHKLYSHTHSFVHYGFYKAFNSLGYETLWLDDSDDVSSYDFSNSLFLTEGQVCKNIPIRKDCRYVFHNVDCNKIDVDGLSMVGLQVYHKDCIKYEKINDYTFFDGSCLYQPWATDLLPSEIDINETDEAKKNLIHFIGTITDGWNDINYEMECFERAANERGIEVVKLGGYGRGGFVPINESIDLISSSYCSPILQSLKQREMMYIPCRIFKNISYGQHPITNCDHLRFLFPEGVIYNSDTYSLFFDYERKKKVNSIRAMMNEVRRNHTYINRIKQILEVL